MTDDIGSYFAFYDDYFTLDFVVQGTDFAVEINELYLQFVRNDADLCCIMYIDVMGSR